MGRELDQQDKPPGERIQELDTLLLGGLPKDLLLERCPELVVLLLSLFTKAEEDEENDRRRGHRPPEEHQGPKERRRDANGYVEVDAGEVGMNVSPVRPWP